MKFIEPHEYQSECEELFRYYRGEIQVLLPKAVIEHIGASSIPQALSKGDLDIYVGVDAEEFERSVELLLNLGFYKKQDTFQSIELNMLCSNDKDVALQVVSNGSEFEFFLQFRDALRKEPALVGLYNQMKMSCVGLEAQEYREKKSAFIEKILSQA